MKWVLAAAALTVLLMVSPPAFADWQFTRWGMTVQELRAASPTPLTATPIHEHFPGRDGSEYLLQTPYEASGITSVAAFAFKNGRLVAVALTPPKVDDGFRLVQLAKQVYGEPAIREEFDGGRVRRRTWRDVQSGNLVYASTTNTPDVKSAYVKYSPLPTKAGTGL